MIYCDLYDDCELLRGPGMEVRGDWPPARRGWSRPQTAGRGGSLLPVTLFVVADEMLSKKDKKINSLEQTNWSARAARRFFGAYSQKSVSRKRRQCPGGLSR